MNKQLLSSVAAIALLAGCAETIVSPPEFNNLDKDVLEQKVDVVNETRSTMPDWYLEMPVEEDAVFSAGVAVDQSLELGKSIAILNAKRSLADRVDGRLDSRTKQFTTRVGNVFTGTTVSEVERATTNQIVDVDVSGYSVVKVEPVPFGPMWRVYVLLKYPTTNNDILAGKVAKLAQKTAATRAEVAFKKMDNARLKKAEVETSPTQPIVVSDQ